MACAARLEAVMAGLSAFRLVRAIRHVVLFISSPFSSFDSEFFYSELFTRIRYVSS